MKFNTNSDTIKTDKFWLLIDNAVKISKGDDQKKEKYLISELTKLSLEEIKDFEIAFRKAIRDANDFGVMGAQKIINGYVSDDSYLYFRCWLIGQGKNIYSETLKNPDYLVNVITKNHAICEFEGLMYVATNAYEKVTGKKEDETFPRNFADNMGLSYDFNITPTKGTDWKEDELPTRFPKLWTKLK